MMQLITTKKFWKMYLKLNEIDQKRVDNALEIFIRDPFAVELNNHWLKWEYKGHRSINAWFDLRIIFFEEKEVYEIIELEKVWSHSEIYW